MLHKNIDWENVHVVYKLKMGRTAEKDIYELKKLETW